MKYATGPTGELKGILQTIEEALGKLENATPEMAEKTVLNIFPSASDDVSRLVPFTGYYGIKGTNTSAGAFLCIDTTEVYIKWPIGQKFIVKLQVPIITISVSLNGTTSTSHRFDHSASVDGQTLIVPDAALQVSLTRAYKSGQLVTLSGTIAGNTITGFTYFNPVQMPVFAGIYKNTQGGQAKLKVAADSSVAFDFGNGLQNVRVFTYDLSMYVLWFAQDSVSYTLMLGTEGGGGLACFITAATLDDPVYTMPVYTIPSS